MSTDKFKELDYYGLAYFWNKIKNKFALKSETNITGSNGITVTMPTEDSGDSVVVSYDNNDSVVNHISDNDIHVTPNDKANWNGKQGALSTAQLNACNSGITNTKVNNYDTHVANSDVHVTTNDKTKWNDKYTKAEVDNKISGLVNSAPETLDTLNELAQALGNDPNFATTIANQIGNKANKDNVYTKSETDTLLDGKSDTTHNHDTAYLGIKAKAESAKSADSVTWNNVSGKPSSYTPSSHTHDDRYYTESEIDTKLSGKANDSDVVHKSGNETIGGVKTFSSDIYSTNSQHLWFRYLDGSKNGGMDGNLYLNYSNSSNHVFFNGGTYYINGGYYNGRAENSQYSYWLRTSSHADHLFHTEWDGSYFWTYVTAGDGGYRGVRVERSNSSGYVQGNNESANVAYALLRSGGGRTDSSPEGDTWIFWDELGGSGAPWGFKHNQFVNTIGFYGAGTETSSINLASGHFSGTVDWSRVINRPTKVSQFTNDSRYISTSSNNYNFINESLNGVNINNDCTYSYTAAISESGHGTNPTHPWYNIQNFNSSHFMTQFATTVNSSNTEPKQLFMRSKWDGGSWSDWAKFPSVCDIAHSLFNTRDISTVGSLILGSVSSNAALNACKSSYGGGLGYSGKFFNVSGSAINPCALWTVSGYACPSYYSATLTGTWRMLGGYNISSSIYSECIALFVRIA